MICWSCYWGWPRPVAEIYLRALAELDGNEIPLLSGPAHIVWEDENFDSAEWCLENFDTYKCDYEENKLNVVRRSLEELAKLPIEVRCIEPHDYDGANPQNFPPSADVVKVK